MLKSPYSWLAAIILLLVITNIITGYLLYNSKSNAKDVHHECLIDKANAEKRLEAYRIIDSLHEAKIGTMKAIMSEMEKSKKAVNVKYKIKYEKSATIPDSAIIRHIDSLLSECRQHPLPGDFTILE